MLFFLLGVICSIFIYCKFVKPCRYWKEKGIKCAKSWPLVGNMGKVFLKRQPFVDVTVNLYNNFPDERYVGYMQFTRRFLLIRDIDLIRQLTVKNFDNFIDHTIFGLEVETDQFLNKSLIGLKGEKWKDMRATLNPVFATNKIKNMYRLIDECAEEFVKYFEGEAELEIKEIFSKCACNVIASTAFGVEIDCLKEPKNEFLILGKRLNQSTMCQTIKLFITQLSKRITKLFRIQIFSRRATAYFTSVVKENIQKRENENVVRPDLIQVLLEARQGKLKSETIRTGKPEGFAIPEDSELDQPSTDVELTDDHIAAQAMLFFVAGFDTISTTSSFMAHELAVNPEIQKKLQEEIDTVKTKHGGRIPYDALLSMKYLDQVVSETLRLWPTGFETDRLCVKDYLIEAKKPDEKALLIQKGVIASIPIMAIHRDPNYFTEPNRFDPERFNDANKSKIIPGTFMPFGVGPRNCIGSRFALLEIKTLFCHLLSKFDIVPIKKTEIPIKISSKSYKLQPSGGFWLGLKPRKESSC